MMGGVRLRGLAMRTSAALVIACAPTRSGPVPAPTVAPAVIRPEPGPPPAAETAAVVAEAPAVEAPADDEAPTLPWPPDVPPLAGARVIEVARISANVGDSPTTATYVVAAGDVHAVTLAWIASAQQRGFRVLAERSIDRVHVASLIDAAGRRANLLMQVDEQGTVAGMFGRGGHAQVRLKGKCGEAPLRTLRFQVDRGAITHGGGYRRELIDVRVESQLGHDLDGDGELDALVPTSDRARCPVDVTWTVYLARGGCMHAVGTVGPGELVTWDLQIDRPGPRPLTLEAQRNALGDGGVIATKTRSEYVFDRGKSRYVRTKREEQRGVCHHCPTEECTPGP